MAAVMRAVRRSDFCSTVATFIRDYDQKGFFSFRWAACDLVIIAAALIIIAK